MKEWLKSLLLRILADDDADEPVPDRLREGAFDEGSDTWHYVQNWLHDELDAARVQNDKVANTEHETAAIRGQIKAIKKLLALPADIKRRKDARAQDGSSSYTE